MAIYHEDKERCEKTMWHPFFGTTWKWCLTILQMEAGHPQE
jgi:hypothetical protein